MTNNEDDWINSTIDTSLAETESLTTQVIQNDTLSVEAFSSFDEDEIEENDSILSDDVLSNDLEKTNAVLAAFAVVFLFGLFFVELACTLLFMIYASGDVQNRIIAHGLCKNFPHWQFVENMTDSWCDPRIFNRDFKLNVQCPCFVPEMFRNMTVY